MNNYSIVEFIEESTVEIIPSLGLSDKKTTLWPKGILSILKKYLKNCTEPDTDWSVKIRVLGQAGIYFLFIYFY